MDGQLLWTEVWRTQSEKATAGPCPGASAVQLELQAADGGGSCLGARERGREGLPLAHFRQPSGRLCWRLDGLGLGVCARKLRCCLSVCSRPPGHGLAAPGKEQSAALCWPALGRTNMLIPL